MDARASGTSRIKTNLQRMIMINSNGHFGFFCFLLTMIVFTFTLWQMYAPLQSYRPHIIRAIMSRVSLDQYDYAKLINLADFSFRIFENICRDSEPFLLMMVLSAPDNFQRRKAIRKTWGRNTSMATLVFLLGVVKEGEVDSERKLILENVAHRDLLQGNFLDSYKNLSYKHVMGLKYATYHCPKTKYILKADDDVFVNTNALLDFLNSSRFSPDLLFCSKMTYSPALRDPESKWYVSFEEFPEKFYPPYCSGFAMVYSLNVASKLYKTAQRSKYFWVEDAYVTGVLAKPNNLSQTDASRYVMNAKDVVQITNGSATEKKFFFAFNLSTKKIEELWKHLCC